MYQKGGKMSKTLFNKIVLWSVIIFLLLLAPSEINLPNQSAVRAICTGLAIDVSQTDSNKISLTSQIVIPQAGSQYKQNMSLVTTEGDNLMDAFNKMDYQIGKKVGLSHCCFIIIGYEASQKNLAETLDYLVRGNNAGNNIVLVHTLGNAKDLIKISSSVNSNEVDNIQTIANYNDQYLASGQANLKSFYDDYLSPHSTSIMSCITMSSEEQSGSSSSGGSSGNSGSSSGGSTSGGSSSSSDTSSSGHTATQDRIKNEGEISVFKDGKLATVLSSEQRKQFNWLDNGLKDSYIELDNITDALFDNATIGFTIMDKDVQKKFCFVNQTPCLYTTINLKLRTEMILSNGEILPNLNYKNEVIAKAFFDKANNDVTKAIRLQQEYGFDVFNFYQGFEIADYISWQKYLDTLPDPTDYMKGVQVFVKVNVDTYGLSEVTKTFK